MNTKNVVIWLICLQRHLKDISAEMWNVSTMKKVNPKFNSQYLSWLTKVKISNVQKLKQIFTLEYINSH